MATYKLKNGQTDSGIVPGIGEYVDGVLENAPDDFENPNFEKVAEQTASAPQAPAPTAPAAPTVSPAPAQPQTPTNTQTQENE